MAWESPVHLIGPFTASANFTSAKQQYVFVTSTNGTSFKKVATKGAHAIGVLQDTPSSGTAGQVMTLGITKLRCSSAHLGIVVGSAIISSSLGLGQKSTGVGQYVMGRALSALTTNSSGIITLQLTYEGAGSSGQN